MEKKQFSKDDVLKLTEKEKGQGLAIVLCFLAIGSLTVIPLLNHTYTGLTAGQIYESSMELRYAMDAGMEDGIWKADNDEITLDPYDYISTQDYSLPEDMNNKR